MTVRANAICSFDREKLSSDSVSRTPTSKDDDIRLQDFNLGF